MRSQDERIASCVMVKASEEELGCLPTMLAELTRLASFVTSIRRNRRLYGKEAKSDKKRK
jgi:hypothetical protein